MPGFDIAGLVIIALLQLPPRAQKTASECALEPFDNTGWQKIDRLKKLDIFGVLKEKLKLSGDSSAFIYILEVWGYKRRVIMFSVYMDQK